MPAPRQAVRSSSGPSDDQGLLAELTSEGGGGLGPAKSLLRTRNEMPSARAERVCEAPLGKNSEAGLLAQVGGDYWTGPYDLGFVSQVHVDTAGAGISRGGSALSRPFRVGPGSKFVSYRVGAGGGESTAVELCVVTGDGCVPLAGDGKTHCHVDEGDGKSTPLEHDVYHGPGRLRLKRVVCDVSALAGGGKELRLRIRDETDARPPARACVDAHPSLGFLLVDDLRVDSGAPAFVPPRVWGFADLHAHVFNNLGTGGRFIHGAVFDSSPGARQKSKLAQMKAALGTSCRENHGPNGNAFTTEFPNHDTRGYPDFKGWPLFRSTAHQQTYVDWIERAYRGGLRLMQVDVGNEAVFAAAYEQFNRGLVPPLSANGRSHGDGLLVRAYGEDDVRKTELDAAARFVGADGPARDWAEIATTAGGARAAATRGKLVLVLGTETEGPDGADLSALMAVHAKPVAEARPIVRAYVTKLQDARIRHVIPVHVMPNVFGAPAIYDRLLFCSSLPQRGFLPSLRDGMTSDVRYHVNFQDTGIVEFMKESLATNSLESLVPDAGAREARATLGPFARGDCYKADVDELIPHFVARKLTSSAAYGFGSTMADGTLTRLGEIFIEELMRAGMLVDVQHMSQASRLATLALGLKYHYPIMASHGGYRELSMGNVGNKACGFKPPPVQFHSDGGPATYGTSDIGKVAAESALTREELVAIGSLGGVVGLGLGTAGVGVEWPSPGVPAVPVDCDGTAKSFAQPLRYAREFLGGRGIALGTDVNGFFGLPPPRFETQGCYPASQDALRSGKGNAYQDPCTKVAYRGREVLPCNKTSRIDGYSVWDSGIGKNFDVNGDGVAHYGLLPDFLQDLANVGVTKDELSTLFGSVEDYLRMWELAERRGECLRGESAGPECPRESEHGALLRIP